MSCLVLNFDGAPISLLPPSVIPWEESIKYLVLEKAVVLEWHDDWIVRSPNWETRVPAVMILKEYQKKKPTLRFSKYNVFLRDGFICQYCGTSVTKNSATLDHVIPTCYGGRHTWDNCTTSCSPCNSRKSNNTEIQPKIKPFKPTYYQLAEKRKTMKWDFAHPSWENYLG